MRAPAKTSQTTTSALAGVRGREARPGRRPRGPAPGRPAAAAGAPRTSSVERLVELDHPLPRPGPGHRDVAGERQRATAQVQDVAAARPSAAARSSTWPIRRTYSNSRWRRVGEVDVRLRGAVDQRAPTRRRGRRRPSSSATPPATAHPPGRRGRLGGPAAHAGDRGATADQRTVSSPSRHRRRRPHQRPPLVGQRLRGRGPALPGAERRQAGGGGPGGVERAQELVHRLARARCGGSAPWAAARRGRRAGARSATRAARVRVSGPSASRATQAERRPHSSQVPSTSRPPGASAAHMVSQARAADSSSYWRSTLNARTRTGRSPASSKPPSAEVQPRRVPVGGHRGDPLRVDLQPDDLQPGHPRRQPLGQLHRGDGRGAVAEVDDERLGGVAQPRDLGGHQPAVDPPQPVGVRRAAGRQPQRPRAAGGQPRASPSAACPGRTARRLWSPPLDSLTGTEGSRG